MKKTLACIAGGLVAFVAAGTASAGPLDLEISKPYMVYNSTGVTTYDASTDVFSSSATLIAAQYDGIVILIPIGQATIDMRFKVRSNGRLNGGVSGHDLVMEGEIDVDGDGVPEYTGTLLTGEVRSFAFLEAGSTDEFDVEFDVTGGSMAGIFGKRIGINHSVENSTFNDSFCYSWMGGGKGTVGNQPGEECPKEPKDWKRDCDWPVERLSIGGVSYNRNQLRNLLDGKWPNGGWANGDAAVELAEYLIAAKLSNLDGAVMDDETAEAMVLADAFLAAFPIGTDLSGDEADLAAALSEALAMYIEESDCGKGKDCGWGGKGGKGGKGGHGGGKGGKGGKDDCRRYRDHCGWGGKGGYGGGSKGGKGGSKGGRRC